MISDECMLCVGGRRAKPALFISLNHAHATVNKNTHVPVRPLSVSRNDTIFVGTPVSLNRVGIVDHLIPVCST